MDYKRYLIDGTAAYRLSYINYRITIIILAS